MFLFLIVCSHLKGTSVQINPGYKAKGECFVRLHISLNQLKILYNKKKTKQTKTKTFNIPITLMINIYQRASAPSIYIRYNTGLLNKKS